MGSLANVPLSRATDDFLDGVVADGEAALLHVRGHDAKRHALAPQCHHLPGGSLLLLDLDQRAIIRHPITERHLASEVSPTLALILLHVEDALADAVALGLCRGGEDREEELAEGVAREPMTVVRRVTVPP